MKQSSFDLIVQAVEEITGGKAEITLDTDLYADGVMDSLDFMKLIFTLESRTGIHFPDVNLAENGFTSVEKLTAYFEASIDK